MLLFEYTVPISEKNDLNALRCNGTQDIFSRCFVIGFEQSSKKRTRQTRSTPNIMNKANF